MTVLFGHPTGNPNSHQAALSHFERGRLEALCVPWMPSSMALRVLGLAAPLRKAAQRLNRRRFPPLADAPKIQGRVGEWKRLLARARGTGDERLSYEANDWLMKTMAREIRRTRVNVVHAYEDCSLLQFVEAQRLGKACIYDMPIGYYPAWERVQSELLQQYGDWLPAGGFPSSRYVRPQQKSEEMRLADLVLVPSTFVADTVRRYQPEKVVALAPYGVDTAFWAPADTERKPGPLRFIYAGQLSLRKGTPLLLRAWGKAALKDATLELVGSWQLATQKRRELPAGVTCYPPCSREELREKFRAADVLVFPSFFEGLALVLLEALSCGLPIIAAASSGAGDILSEACGRVLPTGDADGLVETLREFAANAGRLSAMAQAARRQAQACTWQRYRETLAAAVDAFA